MMKIWSIILLLLALLNFSYANSDSIVDLSVIIEEAKLNNPEIQAAKARYEAARSRVSGIRNLMDPMIEIEFAENMSMYSVSQQIPFPTKISASSNFALTEAEQFQYRYQKKVNEIIRKVKEVYVQLFLIDRKIETVERSIALIMQFHNVAMQKYSLSETSQADLLRNQIELAKTENELLTFEDERKIVEARLNTLLNRPIDSNVGAVPQLNLDIDDMNIEELYRIANDNQPELRAAAKMLQKAEIMVSIAKQRYLPDFMFKFAQLEMDNSLQGQKFMFGFTFPLWFWGKQNNMVKEAHASVRMASAQFQNIKNNVFFAVKETKIKIEKQRRAIELYINSILPQAEMNMRSSFAAYKANRIDFLRVIESEKILIQFEFDYHRAQADLFLAIAHLEEILGIDIINN